jgi:hypothetical protein
LEAAAVKRQHAKFLETPTERFETFQRFVAATQRKLAQLKRLFRIRENDAEIGKHRAAIAFPYVQFCELRIVAQSRTHGWSDLAHIVQNDRLELSRLGEELL